MSSRHTVQHYNEVDYKTRLDRLADELRYGQLSPSGQQYAIRKLIAADKPLPPHTTDASSVSSSDLKYSDNNSLHTHPLKLRFGEENALALFKQELDNILNPPYGSPEWVAEIEKLFTDKCTQLFVPDPKKSLIQKMKIIQIGRRDKESSPPISQRWLRTRGSIPSNLTTRTTFSAKNTLPEANSYQACNRFKRRRKVGSFIAATILFAGAILGSTGSKISEVSEKQSERIINDYEAPITMPTTTESTIIVSEDVNNSVTPPKKTTQTSQENGIITITIEQDSNIWDATKSELQKINPGVTNQMIAHTVNSIIWFSNLENPNTVHPGDQFTVDLKALNSIIRL